MAGITQNIPNYYGGISEQPDQLKNPGQVKNIINGIPDITSGLYKRPGSKRVTTNPLTNVATGGSWFHYYRDETEGSYIGQVDTSGVVRMWSCADGSEQTVHYHTAGQVFDSSDVDHTTIANYLSKNLSANAPTALTYSDITSASSVSSEDIQALTINDTTFLNNRKVPVKTSVDTATYARSGTTVTVTQSDHGLATGDSVHFNFSGSATDGTYTITKTDANIFTLTDTASGTIAAGTTVTKYTPYTSPKPHAYAAYIDLLRLENGRQYSLNIFNAADEHETKTATSLKLMHVASGASGVLTNGGPNVALGSGDCPGTGVQVFTGEETNPTAVAIATSLVSTGADTITWKFHGFITGDTVEYTSNGTNMTHTSSTDFTDGQKVWVIRVDDDTIKLASSYSNATAGTAYNIDGAGNNNQTFKDLSDKSNLCFRITTQGATAGPFDDDASTDANSFRCVYTKSVDLLHGGEDWRAGDTCHVVLDSAVTNFDYVVRVQNKDTTKGKGKLGNQTSPKAFTYDDATLAAAGKSGKTPHGTPRGLIRPAPTPWSGETSITSAGVLGSIVDEINKIKYDDGTAYFNTEIIGTGLYISSDNKFSVEVLNPDLMRVMQDEVNDVSELPIQCKHGYIVKVSNSAISNEDDYYLKFKGQDDINGPGSWTECPKPGIVKQFNPSTMPHVVQRQADNTFLVKKYTWDNRAVGDDTTNYIPSFVSIDAAHPDHTDNGGTKSNDNRFINKVLFFRNRLTFLSNENVITSKQGDFGQFWADTALTISNSDPIDIASSSTLPSELFDGIDVNPGLMVFSTNAQYLLTSDDTIFNPDTAKLKRISSYSYNNKIPPISLGTTVGYVDSSNKNSRFMETANVATQGEATVINQTKTVPTLLAQDIDLLTNSRENGLVFFGKTNSDTVAGFKYVTIGDTRLQASWFKWKFNNPILYHFLQDEEYYYLDTDNFLQKINLIQATTDPSLDKDSDNYLLHLDNYTTLTGGVYNSSLNETQFTASWLSSVTTPNGALAIIDDDETVTRSGNYTEPTVDGTTITASGDWTSVTVQAGYLYDYQVDFPRIYLSKKVEKGQISDINSSLILHRINLSFGKLGTYETVLTRVGKDTYTDLHECSVVNDTDADGVPYITQDIKTIPVYDRNKNVNITLKSTHPSPATLYSMSWEGDYSPMYYRRG